LSDETKRQRRRHRRDEWRTHTSLTLKLHSLIDPNEVFWTSLENRPSSWLNGLLQKKRGVRSGLPDLMFIPLAASKPTFIELKSKAGHASKSQKQVRAELVAVGCQWFMARSVPAALEALRCAGVPFRLPWSEAVHLKPWEGPFPDPTLRLPQHPDVRARRRKSDNRYRERMRDGQVRPTRVSIVTPEHRRAVVREAVRRWRARQREAYLRSIAAE
jgi:hypothetical protein